MKIYTVDIISAISTNFEKYLCVVDNKNNSIDSLLCQKYHDFLVKQNVHAGNNFFKNVKNPGTMLGFIEQFLVENLPDKNYDDIVDWVFPNNIREMWRTLQEEQEQLIEQYQKKIEEEHNSADQKKNFSDYHKVQIIPIIRDMASNLSKALEGNDVIFYKQREGIFVEVVEFEDKFLKNTTVGFKPISIPRFVNLLENELNIWFYRDIYNKAWKSSEEVQMTPAKKDIELLMSNTKIRESIYPIDRLLKCPMPFLLDGQLVLPNKGYDERFHSFLVKDCPKVELIEVEDAKVLINFLFEEFCFKEPVDKTMAIAALFTPACRGLYSKLTCRTPLFIYLGNREGCGKDYCAGITGIVYEGKAIETTPISTSSQNNNSGEETRKKLTALILTGSRRFHSSNNKGFINNSEFEQILTAEQYKDRILGKTDMIELANEVDFSLSGNVGLGFTADLARRSRKIRFHYEKENINARSFITPDLHGFVLENRSKILSAIYTLIKAWYDAGMPKGNNFASFHDWANVVGGIVKYHELGDPCAEVENDDYDTSSGDRETQDMRQFFVYMGSKPLPPMDGYLMSQLIDEIENLQNEGEMLFGNYKLNERSGRTSMSLKLRKFLDRELGGVTFKILTKSERIAREKYNFTSKMVTSGNLGNLHITPLLGNSNLNIYSIETLPNVTKVTNKSFDDLKQAKSLAISLIKSKGELSIDDLEKSVMSIYPEIVIDSLVSNIKQAGDAFECRPGILRCY